MRFAATALCLVVTLMGSRGVVAQVGVGMPMEGISRLRNYEARRSSSVDPNLKSGNADARQIEPGATLTLAELEGPGVITHIWNTVNSPERGYSRLLTLRMYWDGETSASVECPLGDFFAAGHGVDAVVNTLPVSAAADGRARNSYWPMPFRKSARVTVTNEGRDKVNAFYYYVDWHKVQRLAEDEAYFHAQYRQEFPTVMGKNYVAADIAGRGHYVGTVLSCRARSPEWWGEGDDFFYIDGETTPSLKGTGTEDYFCDAWGFRKFSGAHTGCTVWEGNEKQGGRTTVYRWHLTDAVPFKESLRLEFEHKGVTFKPDGSILTHFAEREDDWSSVAFWYQVEPHKAWEPIPYGYERLHLDRHHVIEAESVKPAEGQAEERVAKVEANAAQAAAKITTVTVSSGYFDVQKLDKSSGGAQILWSPEMEDATLTMTVDVARARKYDLYVLGTLSWDFGIYQVMLDGKPVGRTVDYFAREVTATENVFPNVELSAGAHEISFAGRGKHGESKGAKLGVDGVALMPAR